MAHNNAVVFQDENGEGYGIRQVGNRPIMIAFDKGQAVAEGIYTDHTSVHILGDNDATSSSAEDMWEGEAGSGSNKIIPHPAAAGIQMEIVSSSTDDDSDGTGVRTVRIDYLDANFAEQTETITMNGTTPVNTTATNIRRIQFMETATVGTGGSAAGDITLETTDSATEYCRISTGLNTALKGEWTVPSGKTLLITNWAVSAIASAANRRAEFLLCSTTNQADILVADIFYIKEVVHLTAGGYTGRFPVPHSFPAGSDVKAQVTTSAAMETSVTIEGYYH